MGAGVGWELCHTSLGWSWEDRWHRCHPACPNLLCPTAGLSHGVGAWLVASCPCPDPVASPCPADPAPAPGISPQTWGCGWEHRWALGLLRCWVCLAQGVSKAGGTHRVPPAGTAGTASSSMHAVRVTASTSIRAWGPPCMGGAGVAVYGSQGTPLLPWADAKGSRTQGGLGSRDQPVRADGLPLRNVSPLGPSQGTHQLRTPQHSPSLCESQAGVMPRLGELR